MALISVRQLLDHAAESGYGVPLDEIVQGIRHGVRKVNIDTDCRMAITGQMRKVAVEKPAEFDPRKFQLPGWAAMRDLCRDRFERFGTPGNASRIDIIPLPEMAERYRLGQLDPKTGGRRDVAA